MTDTLSDNQADDASKRAKATGRTTPRRKMWIAGQFIPPPYWHAGKLGTHPIESQARRVMTFAERKALERIEVEHAHLRRKHRAKKSIIINARTTRGGTLGLSP